MRRLGRSLIKLLRLALVCAVCAPSLAQAATVTVGQLSVPDGTCSTPRTRLQTGVASGTQYVAPAAGVITSWSFQTDASPPSVLKLKVGRNAGGGSYTITGEATAGTVAPGTVNTFSAGIPVGAGDLIGIYTSGGDCVTTTVNAADTEARADGEVPLGTTASFATFPNLRAPVTAQITLQPEVGSISPSSGANGTQVTIAGHDFLGATAVTFGGVPARSFTVTSDTSITAVAPAGPAGAADITVRTPGGKSPATAADRFTYVPTVTSVFPPSGTTDGGTHVSIVGRGFTGATAVRFGGVAAKSFKVKTDSTISAAAPSHAKGTVDVTVTGPGGQSQPTTDDQFTFIKFCVVPDVTGKHLKRAKKALKKAHCKLGKVRPKGQTTGTVKHQSRKPGTVLKAGAKVSITLG
jgi:hypothetical protein